MAKSNNERPAEYDDHAARDEDMCHAQDSAYFVCTRTRGHDGKHEAGIGGGLIISSWGNVKYPAGTKMVYSNYSAGCDCRGVQLGEVLILAQDYCDGDQFMWFTDERLYSYLKNDKPGGWCASGFEPYSEENKETIVKEKIEGEGRFVVEYEIVIRGKLRTDNPDHIARAVADNVACVEDDGLAVASVNINTTVA